MRVAVIIPAFNAERTLARCLEACARQTRPAEELIVVDDGSTDATPRIAQSHGVHFLQQDRRGPAAARNNGAHTARADVVVFTDSDCVPEPQWLERLLAGLAPGVAGVGGSYGIVNPEYWLARMVHEEIVARHAGLGEDVDFLGSFNVAYAMEAFNNVGGFDESFTAASSEDNDLAYRIQDAGGSLRFAPEARVAHFHPTRLWPYLGSQRRHGCWRMKLYQKHPNRASRGDKYAGMADLLAPPFALCLWLSWAALAGAALAGHYVTMGVYSVVLATVGYSLFHCMRAARLARRTGEIAALAFAGVTILRDLARGIGLVQGIVRFQLRGSPQA